MLVRVAILLTPLLFTACIEKQTPISNPSEIYQPDSSVLYTPSQPQRLQTFWSQLPEGNKWTYFTQRAIAKYGQGLLNSTPRDVAEYCPRYPELSRSQRGDFWVHFIAKLAYFESSYNPQTSYVELFYDNNGNPVVSRGLLQISKESANGANYRCGIKDEKELHDPKTNLECGVRILNKWVTNDGVIVAKEGDKWRGVARYWGVLRDGVKRAKITESLVSLPMCH
jgi:hypothetical protein